MDLKKGDFSYEYSVENISTELNMTEFHLFYVMLRLSKQEKGTN